MGENAVSQVGREGLLRHDVDGTMHQILQVLFEPHEIQQRASFRERDEEIEIAAHARLAASLGAENPHVRRSVTPCHVEDLRPVLL